MSISGRTVNLQLTSRQFICKDGDRNFYEKFAFVNSLNGYLLRAFIQSDISTHIETKAVLLFRTLESK